MRSSKCSPTFSNTHHLDFNNNIAKMESQLLDTSVEKVKMEIFNFIKVDEIIDFIAANPSLAGPIFIIQTNLRQNVMNTNFWIDQAGARSSGSSYLNHCKMFITPSIVCLYVVLYCIFFLTFR